MNGLGVISVSYTHLDVYKRQLPTLSHGSENWTLTKSQASRIPEAGMKFLRTSVRMSSAASPNNYGIIIRRDGEVWDQVRRRPGVTTSMRLSVCDRNNSQNENVAKMIILEMKTHLSTNKMLLLSENN